MESRVQVQGSGFEMQGPSPTHTKIATVTIFRWWATNAEANQKPAGVTFYMARKKGMENLPSDGHFKAGGRIERGVKAH